MALMAPSRIIRKPSPRTATLVVAASNASGKSKRGADYVCDGTADEVQINAAIAALPAVGGTVVLTEGGFTTTASIAPTTLTTLRGQGVGITQISAGAGMATGVVQIPKSTGYIVVRDLSLIASDQASTPCIYVEATAGASTDRPYYVLLENLILDYCVDTALKIDTLFESRLSNIYMTHTKNGLLWANNQNGMAGNSDFDRIVVDLDTNDGVGFEFNACGFITGRSLQVQRYAAETGLVAIKLVSCPDIHLRGLNIEAVTHGVQVSGTAENCSVAGGYIAANAEDTGVGIIVASTCKFISFSRLTIEGITGGTSVGINDDVATAGLGSRYRDCNVKTFDTLVDPVAGCTSVFENNYGYAGSGEHLCAVGALAAGAANAFAFAWQNPHAAKVFIDYVIVETTTAGGTATAVLDVDIAGSATGTGDSILDGIDLNATAIYDSRNATDNGTNGIGKAIKCDENGGTNDFVTGKILVEAASSLVGKYYIYYTVA